MLKNGIIQDTTISGIPFRVDLIPVTNKTSRPAYKMDPTSITVHNTGNSSKGADAEAHTEYVDNTTAYVSWHFTVDDKQIIQELPIIENAWHAGDGGSGKGNRTSIAIEVCENNGIDWKVARDNAINLIVYLMKETGIELGSVVPHKKWSGKNCPHVILAEGWDKFIDDIEYRITEQTPSAPDPKDEQIQDLRNDLALMTTRAMAAEAKLKRIYSIATPEY